MTIEELKTSKDHTLHHTAWKRGYLTRKIEAAVYSYKGKYGEGYIAETPCYTSTRYHYISYYIKKEHFT